MNKIHEIKELERVWGVKMIMYESSCRLQLESSISKYEKEVKEIAEKLKIFDEDTYNSMMGAVDALKEKYKK